MNTTFFLAPTIIIGVLLGIDLLCMLIASVQDDAESKDVLQTLVIVFFGLVAGAGLFVCGIFAGLNW